MQLLGLLKKHKALVVIALLLAVAIIWGLIPRPVQVEVESVRRAPMSVSLVEEGKTRVIHRFVISAPVAGYIRRVTLDNGSRIQRGETLIEMEPLRSNMLDARSHAEAVARVGSAESNFRSVTQLLEAARAEKDLADITYRRQKELYEKKTGSRHELDIAEAEQRRAAAALQATKFDEASSRYSLEMSRSALKYTAASSQDEIPETITITTPIDGQVLHLFHESAGVVNAGEPLIEIGDPAALEVEIDVLSADAVRIRPGTRVIFERWGGKGSLQGEVRIVEPQGFTKTSALGVEEQRVLIVADITSPHREWERLGDGYRVETRFTLWEGEDILQAPNSALFRVNDAWALFVAEGGHARVREVTIGQRNSLSSEVVAGVSEGEQIIVHPSDAVSEGVAIAIR